MEAHQYLMRNIGCNMAFKNDLFFAYNDEYFDYLERYISATLRAHKGRSHFTLLEKKHPNFIMKAKKREGPFKNHWKVKNNLMPFCTPKCIASVRG